MVAGARILAALQDSGALEAPNQRTLLREICAHIGLRRQSNAECEQVLQVLYRLVARGLVRLVFASDQEDADIVGAERVLETHEKEVARLTAELAAAHRANDELRSKLQAGAADVAAAQDLAAQAELEREQAQDALRLAEQAHRAAVAAHARDLAVAQAGHPRVRDARRIRTLTAQLERAQAEAAEVAQLRTRVTQLGAELDEVQEILKGYTFPPGTKVNIVPGTFANNEYLPGCGCTVKRISVQHCRQGGYLHGMIVAAIPRPVDSAALLIILGQTLSSIFGVDGGSVQHI